MLEQVLRPIKNIFTQQDYPDLMIGLGSIDDAAVWSIDKDRALVVSTDFFTPVVDDPYDYGAIAAANALSDIYAMGGKPFLALNISAFPPDIPVEICSDILRGGAEKAMEAGVVIAGGHTIQDKEPKYGLAVLGFVHPEKVIVKSGAEIGDQLYLTKPIGTGTITTALKNRQAHDDEINEAVAWMKILNRASSDLASRFGIKAGTDITGFGLLGHSWELARESGVGIKLIFDNIPVMDGAKRTASAWQFPGGTSDNLKFFSPHVEFASRFSEVDQMLLFDPQTSGGLLLCVPEHKVKEFEKTAKAEGQDIWHIGEITKDRKIEVL